MTDCSEQVVEKIKTDLDNWMVGGVKHHASMVLDQVQGVHRQMKQMIQDIQLRSNRVIYWSASGDSDNEVELGSGRNRGQIFHWRGKIHNVPKDFEVPMMTLGALITVWYCGDRRQRIPPLRYIQAYDLPHKRNAKVLISQMRKMMMYIRKAAEVIGFSMPMNSNDMMEEDSVSLYSAVKGLFKYNSLRVNFKRRFEEILRKTVFNLISKYKGKFADEVNLLI